MHHKVITDSERAASISEHTYYDKCISYFVCWSLITCLCQRENCINRVAKKNENKQHILGERFMNI